MNTCQPTTLCRCRMPRDRVVIVGAGIAGLVSAFALAARGLDVTMLERSPAPGGKMRQIGIGSSQIDSGPTVFTMHWVFDELFGAAGKNFSDHVRLRPLEILARHAWDERSRLDLFANEERSVEAIGAIQRTIREVGEITAAIAAAVTEQGAATREIARSAETASQRTVETAREVGQVNEATADTRKQAGDVKSVSDRLGVAASSIRGQIDGFFQKLRAA